MAFAAVSTEPACAPRVTDGTLLCSGAEKDLRGVWDADRKQAVERGLLHSGEPYAAHAAHRVREIMDDYTGSWAAARKDACEATRFRGEQSEALLDLRMQCLERRASEVKALGEVLAHADVDVARHAVQAAEGLTALEIVLLGLRVGKTFISRPPPYVAIADSGD